MAADFFEQQDIARRHTGRLVVLFVLAVLAILATLYALAVVVVGFQGQDPSTGAVRFALDWQNPQLFAEVLAATLLVIGGGSLYKVIQLRAGGKVVAEQLGGRLLHADSREPLERKLLNVVEEMALAAGTPTPHVYLLDAEPGINAFAAGSTPADAVLGITRGCVEQLSRDELQGVIGHEFSHILNGDMRLNIRLMGVLHGILLIGILGYFLLRSSFFAGGGRGRSGRDNSGAIMLAVGLGLMVVGFLGTFFGNLIKASVSRQREFLADASAVQFTRNPRGIAGALKKIAGLTDGSAIRSPSAPEASHLFFGNGLRPGLSSLFATHPPLAERIRRLDPSWDASQVESTGGTAAAASPALRAGPAAAALPGLAAGTAAATAAVAGSAVAHIGRPTAAHLARASELLQSIPGDLQERAHEPYGARALVYALLLDSDPASRKRQLEQLARHADPAVGRETLALSPRLESLDAFLRLPLVDLALPALRELSPSQYQGFSRTVEELVKADDRIDLFEWTLQRLLMQHLRPHFEPTRPPRIRYSSLRRLERECAAVLSTLAYAGRHTPEQAQRAWESAVARLGLPHLRPLAREQCGLAVLDEALFKLAETAPQLKRLVVHACADYIQADGAVSLAEGELLRATADTLGCPMPPLLPDQPLIAQRGA